MQRNTSNRGRDGSINRFLRDGAKANWQHSAVMSPPISPVRFERRPIIVMMGVAGSGKSTVAAALATRLRLPNLEGDDFHAKANIRKMSRGEALTDEDRWPWLAALGEAMRACADEEGGAVAACSALRRVYRDHLAVHVAKPMLYVVLDVDRETLMRRLRARRDHFMPESLLESQLATLERPTPDEPAVVVPGDQGVERIVDELSARLA